MPWKKDFTLSDEMSPSGIVWPAGKAAVSVVVDYSVPADAFASRADRNSRQRLNTNVQFLKVVNLAHRAIDHQPFPFILDGQTRQVCVN